MDDFQTHSGLYRHDFQQTIDGKETDLYVLTNEAGGEVAVTNYGCALLTWLVPDKEGKMGNVLQGHDSIQHLIDSDVDCLSTTIGRYGNRICDGRFTLDGKEYRLECNNGKNSLHGGPKGFHKRVWTMVSQSGNAVTFRYQAQDGEEGFPGTLSVTLTYSLDNDNALSMDYRAECDKKTIVNLTNHAFFSLSGIGNPTPSQMGNIVTINADFYLPTDETNIPTGEILKVADTPMDFRTPHAIGERIDEPFEQLKCGHGYDHCYVLNKTEAGDNTLAATCFDPVSGRTLEVFTTEPGVQFYTANWNHGMKGAFGSTFPDRSAVCFEAQHFPDTPNRSYFPTAVLNPGETYKQTTVYRIKINH